MQTFLPYPDFAKSAEVLDRQRLGKQRVEAKQIYLACIDLRLGLENRWAKHPAVLMWYNHEYWLAQYGRLMCYEWARRGYRDNLYGFFWDNVGYGRRVDPYPEWLSANDDRLCSSHRAALLAKDYRHYSQFGWTEEPAIAYFWPVSRKG